MRQNPNIPLVLVGIGIGAAWLLTRKKKPKQVLDDQAAGAQREELSGPLEPVPEAAGFVAWPADGALRLGMEIVNAKYAVTMKPMEHAGHVGLPTSNSWLTNVAFWMTYPEALGFPDGKIPSNFKSVPDWKKFANAWVRIFKLVKKYRAEPLPKPAPKPPISDPCKGKYWESLPGQWWETALRSNFPGLMGVDQVRRLQQGDEVNMVFAKYRERPVITRPQEPEGIIIVRATIVKRGDRLERVPNCYKRTTLITGSWVPDGAGFGYATQSNLRLDYSGPISVKDAVGP